MLLTRRELLRAIDAPRIKRAIEEAESQTSGEIRVSVAPFFWGDVRRAAERAFARLGMASTRERNGILFFVVPARRRFVVLGDQGIHDRVGDDFWQDVTSAVAERFRDRDFTGGLVHGIETVGRELAAHFPVDPTHAAHQLPTDVDFGR